MKKVDGSDVLVVVGWGMAAVGVGLIWGVGAALLAAGAVMMLVGLAGALRKAG